MNANELADLLEVDSWYKLVTREEIATMLRQQHEEIIKLKLEWQYMYDRANMESTNEPVAWLHFDLDGAPVQLEPKWAYKAQKLKNVVPLYTHPVKEQDESFDRTASHMAGEYVSYKPELTDEEIEEIGKQYLSAHAQFIGAGECHYEGEIDFARAILRKAQEK